MLVHCKLTQGPYVTWFWDTLLESFASCHSYGRNFDYLNCFCTRNCGDGQPHVGLCPAHLVIIIPGHEGRFATEREGEERGGGKGREEEETGGSMEGRRREGIENGEVEGEKGIWRIAVLPT